MKYSVTIEILGKDNSYRYENVIGDGISPDSRVIEMHYLQLETGERIEIPKHNIALISYSKEKQELINSELNKMEK